MSTKNYWSIYCVSHMNDGRVIRNAEAWEGPAASRVTGEGLSTPLLHRRLFHEEERLFKSGAVSKIRVPWVNV